MCSNELAVCVDGVCCIADCAGRQCGDDGCGGSCGTCTGDDACSFNGQCVYPGIIWIALPSGTYEMGSTGGEANEQPVHAVTLNGFEMAATEVTVAQYEMCFLAGMCGGAGTWPKSCNWHMTGKEQHPINCVDWSQAKAYCQWARSRLCTEAEWEYGARSAGKNQAYPWGDVEASCEYAVMFGNDDDGCGTGGTWAVCSKTAGNSEQGVCDLAGNVWEWVADWLGPYSADAETNPTGPVAGSERVIRGGSYFGGFLFDFFYVRASVRGGRDPGRVDSTMGFRCCRGSN